MVDLEKIASSISLGGAKALCKLGLESQKLKDLEDGFLEILVENTLNTFFNNPTYNEVRKILGDDFITPEEIVKKSKKIVYTQEQLVLLRLKIPSLEMINFCKSEGYLLIAGPSASMDLSKFYVNFSGYIRNKAMDELWFRDLNRHEQVHPGWYMIKKTIFRESKNIQYKEKLNSLKGNLGIPTAIQFLWPIIMNYIVRGSHLFEDEYIFTKSIYNGWDTQVVIPNSFNDAKISLCAKSIHKVDVYGFAPIVVSDKYFL